MSETTNQQGEIEKKTPITEEDVENVKNYSKNFGVDITPELQEAMDKFEKDQTYENHLEFKLALCKWMISSPHESFTDSLWDHPKEAAKDIVFDLQFDKELEEELSEEQKKEAE